MTRGRLLLQIREKAHKRFVDTEKRAAIPITVRQLEALVRLSEVRCVAMGVFFLLCVRVAF